MADLCSPPAAWNLTHLGEIPRDFDVRSSSEVDWQQGQQGEVTFSRLTVVAKHDVPATNIDFLIGRKGRFTLFIWHKKKFHFVVLHYLLDRRNVSCRFTLILTTWKYIPFSGTRRFFFFFIFFQELHHFLERGRHHLGRARLLRHSVHHLLWPGFLAEPYRGQTGPGRAGLLRGHIYLVCYSFNDRDHAWLGLPGQDGRSQLYHCFRCQWYWFR